MCGVSLRPFPLTLASSCFKYPSLECVCEEMRDPASVTRSRVALLQGRCRGPGEAINPDATPAVFGEARFKRGTK
ncbi:hypothetical protein E2C01_047683 [Portunus trituberculatus]|uniref:Uncharacterized protein n=1 Tax=Portunus trituberculatus TaxID=210409 RepID=A0A5B7G973_PORTR|nr:hypothetical protein [Portunus trituberculatus]